MNIAEKLKQILAVLDAQTIPYALCGGLAVVLHGYVRTTDDVDLLVLPKDVVRAKAALRAVGFGQAQSEPLHFTNGAFPVTVHRLVHFEDEDHLVVDLLEANAALGDIWAGREAYEWEGRTIWVVSRAGLNRLKRNAGRPQDLADIDHLRLDEDADHGA